MATLPPALLSAALLAVTACTATPTPTTAAPGVRSGARRSGHVSATRSEEECRPLVDSVTAHPNWFQVPEAQLRSLGLPPLDHAPARLRGTTILIRTKVDAHGRVLPDSTSFDPMIGDARYEQRLRSVVGKWRYHPAIFQGCAVPSRGTNRLTLDVRH